jgi:hypothetical protein
MKSVALIAAAALAVQLTPVQAQDTSSKVERCERSLGTIAVAENQGASSSQLHSYGLGSPISLLRIMIQQSGCFTVVERGVAMSNLQEERALAANGETLSGTNIGKGQLQAADFVMTPGVQFAAANTGGIGGALSSYGGKFLGGLGGIVGGVAGNLKFKEAQTSLLIADVRSGIQVAAAEGMAKTTDFGISGWNWGGAGYQSLGGYTNTPEGKMVAASLLDNYNKIVLSVRNQASLIKNNSAASAVNAGAATRSGVPVAAGASVFARLASVKVFSEPNVKSKLMGSLKRSEEAIATGEESNGFVKSDGENVSGGWVQRSLVSTSAAPN